MDSREWRWDEPTETYVRTGTGERLTMAEAQKQGLPADLPRYRPTRVEAPEKVTFAGGGLREDASTKTRFDLLLPLGVPMEQQFLARVARHMQKGCEKYPERNWEQFSDRAALERCRQSAFRHFLAWMTGDETEDHAAAVVFNLMAAEHVAWKLERDDD